MVAAPLPFVSVSGFVLERVNGTRERVAAGASAPLCRAIFVSAIHVRIRARLAPTRATLTATYPGHVVRRHRIRLRARTTVALRAFDERLPGGFTAGTYRFVVRAGRHRATARLRLTAAATC
jgi:hypothetical protein